MPLGDEEPKPLDAHEEAEKARLAHEQAEKNAKDRLMRTKNAFDEFVQKAKEVSGVVSAKYEQESRYVDSETEFDEKKLKDTSFSTVDVAIWRHYKSGDNTPPDERYHLPLVKVKLADGRETRVIIQPDGTIFQYRSYYEAERNVKHPHRVAFYSLPTKEGKLFPFIAGVKDENIEAMRGVEKSSLELNLGVVLGEKNYLGKKSFLADSSLEEEQVVVDLLNRDRWGNELVYSRVPELLEETLHPVAKPKRDRTKPGGIDFENPPPEGTYPEAEK